MITLEQWMKAISFQVTEGSAYGWDCYGPNAWILSHWDGQPAGHETSITIDKVTGEVYEAEVCDYNNNVMYRMINPDFKDSYLGEVEQQNLDRGYIDEPWEGAIYCDSELDDFLNKLYAILHDEPFDTRSVITLDMDKNELFDLMSIAHEQDITTNQLVENILKEMLYNELD